MQNPHSRPPTGARSDVRRRVIVTGASRGIGKAIAERLSADGWSVLNLDKAPPHDDNGAGTWTEVDLADIEGLREAAANVLKDGPVLGLVNNAGVVFPTTLEETTPEEFDLTMAVNMRAPMFLAQLLTPGMRDARFGRIVNISSRASLGKTHRTAYSGSKAGILAMGRVWALELGHDGVTVNTVAPGPIRTELFERANPPGMPRTQEIIGSIPVGRIGETTDIAHAVSFFMDERSSFVTGQTLYVCGGTVLSRGGS